MYGTLITMTLCQILLGWKFAKSSILVEGVGAIRIIFVGNKLGKQSSNSGQGISLCDNVLKENMNLFLS